MLNDLSSPIPVAFQVIRNPECLATSMTLYSILTIQNIDPYSPEVQHFNTNRHVMMTQ